MPLPCCPALLYFLLHILNCFIEHINDDDDDDDDPLPAYSKFLPVKNSAPVTSLLLQLEAIF